MKKKIDNYIKVKAPLKRILLSLLSYQILLHFLI